jgi:hypothetical protein
MKRPFVFTFRMKNDHNILNRGGVVVALSPGRTKTKVGMSVCSLLDNFCTKRGMKIAMGRLYKGETVVNEIHTDLEGNRKLAFKMACDKWNQVVDARIDKYLDDKTACMALDGHISTLEE